MDEITRTLRSIDSKLDAAITALGRERWWRRTTTILIVLGMLSVIGSVSYLRQNDCDRSNHSRAAIRQSIVTGFSSAWDDVGPNDPEAKKVFLTDIDEDIHAILPPRDCSWPA